MDNKYLRFTIFVNVVVIYTSLNGDYSWSGWLRALIFTTAVNLAHWWLERTYGDE